MNAGCGVDARQGGGRAFGAARKDFESGVSLLLLPPALRRGGGVASLAEETAEACGKWRCFKSSIPLWKSGPAFDRMRSCALRFAAAAGLTRGLWRSGRKARAAMRRRAGPMAARVRRAARGRRGCWLQRRPAAQGAVPLGRRGKIQNCVDSAFAARFAAAMRRRFAGRNSCLSFGCRPASGCVCPYEPAPVRAGHVRPCPPHLPAPGRSSAPAAIRLCRPSVHLVQLSPAASSSSSYSNRKGNGKSKGKGNGKSDYKSKCNDKK